MQDLAIPGAEAEESAPWVVGDTLGGWMLEGALAAGPICRSWLASRGEQRAVLRVLRERFSVDGRAREQWLQANWAPNRFHHARVIRVLEQACDPQGRPVIVRAWAEGLSLQEKVQAGVLDTPSALRLAAQLLDALEMAHAHGIVHGALTPSNVVVTLRGSVRLIDFATPPWLHGRNAGSPDLLAAARVGPFTAPGLRHARRPTPNEAADVWSAGACLYLSLLGRAPAAGSLDVAELTRAAGADVAAVVAHSLSRDPRERYESAYAMLGDVRRLLAGRKPKLDGSTAPLSQSAPMRDPSMVRTPWPTTSKILGPIVPAPPERAFKEWRGNLALMLAISLLVGLASFVLVRERLADTPRVPGHSIIR